MSRYFIFLLIILLTSCSENKTAFEENVVMIISTYEDSTGTKASVMPDLKNGSELTPYKRRFEYLWMNISAMHQPEHAEERMAIWGLYPDTIQLRQKYFDVFVQDTLLIRYFEQTSLAIRDSAAPKSITYTADELMTVASRFFYCDAVLPDTSVQTHICIGLNGIKEAEWDKDYTLLEAFCYEAIFTDLDTDASSLWDSCGSIKEKSINRHRSEITTLDDFLNNVKLDVFTGMKNDGNLQRVLLAHYERNKSNLAFVIAE